VVDARRRARIILGQPRAASEQTLVGLLHFSRVGPESTCYFLRCHPAVILDGRALPLSLTTLAAGSILSVGENSWLVAHVWKATPMEAPAPRKSELCPVCSGPLG
jgi:hypothetical protein